MFCNHCGQPIRDDAQFCAVCGKRQGNVVAQPATSPGWDGRVGRNLHILGVLWIVMGALRFVEASWIMLVGHTFFPASPGSFIWDASSFSGHFPFEGMVWSGLTFAAFWMGLFGALEVMVGWGLLERRPWARNLGLIIGFLLLLRFPFGTALGIYTLWVLLPAPSGREYGRLTHAG